MRDLRRIHKAAATTDPAVKEVSRIIHEAAQKKQRRLILLTGVPGAGKTLVGLRTVHAHFLDDLAIPRGSGTPTAPAVFLSGNGPLVEVLQYELRSAGGGGKTFVRGVKDYVKRYSARQERVPPEHVLVFDEAQRAYDAAQVQAKHAGTPGFESGKSEPEHFIEFGDRVPEWCVVLGLIGSGQEIHVGEEAGLVQWRHAIEGSNNKANWQMGMVNFSTIPAYHTSGNPDDRIDTCQNRMSRHSRNDQCNSSCRLSTHISPVQLCTCSRYERNFGPPFPSPPFLQSTTFGRQVELVRELLFCATAGDLTHMDAEI